MAKTLVQPALWFCACNLLAAVLAAQCSNPTQVPNQTISSGTYNFPDNNALSASNVVINGSASVTFVAGNCVDLQPGFHATAGTAGTTFHAWVETAPADVSVSPPSSSGLSQAFTWAVSSPSGYGNLSDVFALFNTSVSFVNACYIHYNRTSNLLYLADASGSNWSTGIVPGPSGTTGNFNPYCTIYGSGSSVSTSDKQLTLTVSVTFQPPFSGTKNRYLIAYDNEGLNTTWLQMGTWTVPAPPQDFTISTSPGTETVVAQGNASYTVTATALNGFNGAITLDAPALPPGASAPTFNPSSLVGHGTSTMTVALGAGGGNFNVTARGTSGSLSHSATSVLDAQDFSLTVSPWSQTVATGGTATVVLTAAGLGGFNGSINLAVYSAPSCGQYSYSPSSITPGVPATFQFNTTSCSPGGYGLGIRGCYGTLCRYIGATVNVGSGPDFTITASPNSQTVAAGGSASYTIGTTSFNGFSGTIYLPPLSLPPGVTASFGSSYIAAGNSTSLTVYTSAGAAAGTYTLGVTGQSGSLTHQAAPFLTVSTTGISVGVTPPAIMLTAGQAQQITANVAGSTNTAVTWSLSGSGTLTGATSNTVQYSAPAPLPGNSTAAITATSQADGLTTGTAQITLDAPLPPSLQTFITCLSAQGTGATCTLPAGRYLISQPIVIGRSNVTAQGADNDRSQTVLLREPNYPVNTTPAPPSAMMQVDRAGPPLSGITIQNLTFCGGSYSLNPAPSSFCSSAYQAMGLNPQGNTTCGQWTQESNAGTNPALCVDLEVDNADTALYPTNPFSNSGPYSVTINNVGLEDAGGHALQLFGNAGWSAKKVNDVYIHNSAINSSGVTGILLGANTPPNTPPLDRKICDAYPDFANDPNIFPPRNIRIESNMFQNNSTGVVAGAPARWVGLRSNTFTNNFINPQGAGNYAGGNVVFEPCADTVGISGNTMTGPPVNPDGTPHTLGLELWGRNITVTGNNNISGFPNEGIVLASVYNATVSGNTVANNDQEVPSHPLNPDPYKTGGISISTFGPGACDQIPRDSQNIVITGNTSTGQAYGVSFMDRGAARNTMEAVTIDSSNTLLGNTDYPIAILSPIIGLIPTLTQAHQLEPLGVDTPRALAPDAVSPVQSRCSTPGSDRETFTFSASDVQGPGAITSIEVRFVTGGANDTGNPGNTAGACGFVYSYAPTFGTDPPFNLVTLETDSGLWPESVVGPGGSDIANGYCTIHAGSPASHVATDPKTLNVTLDIDFLPSSGKRYIYAWVTNTQGTFSNGGTWKYWGWWQIP